MSQVTFINISVGSLPEWYIEEEHDNCLETAIESQWNRTYPEAQIKVEYNYQTNSGFVTAYNDDGDVVFEREHDLSYAFDYAKNNS